MLTLKETRVRTYVDGLDRALNGGIPAGQVLLLSGYPGTMKSSLCFSILHRNATEAGLRGVYITLEESGASLTRQVASLGIPEPTAGGRVAVIDLAQIRKNLAAASKRIPFLQVFTTYVRNVVEGHEADLLVVDSLDALETIANWENRRTSLFHLFELFRGLKSTTFLITEASMDLGAETRNKPEAFLADGILDLSLQPVGETEAQRRIRCTKMRWTPHETAAFALIWDGQSFGTTRPLTLSGKR